MLSPYFRSSGNMSETKGMKQNDTSKIQDAKDTPFASKNLSYLNKPPSIPPNYGRKHYSVCYILKSKISRVLLYDNITQQRMLDRRLNLLGGEQRRVMQLHDYHKKSFENQRNLKHKRLAFQARLPVHQIEETKPVQPEGVTEDCQQQRLPDILYGRSSTHTDVSSSSCGLNPLVNTQNYERYAPLATNREAQTCSHTQYDQMSKLDDGLTSYVSNNNDDNNNNNNNNLDKLQARGKKSDYLYRDYDNRFVSLENLLIPIDKN